MTTSETQAAPAITLRCEACRKWNRVRADRVVDGPKCGSCGVALGLDHPLPLDDDTFDRVVAGAGIPVLVDFYADWCGPCKMMAPAVDTLAREVAGRALVAQLDTERAPKTAARFRITGIPTSIVFVGGREVKRQAGAMPLSALRTLIPS